MFVIVVKYNLDLKLQTQVLHNGEIVLVGLDHSNKEIIKLDLCGEHAKLAGDNVE